jgi:hypothetical protein
MIYAGRWRTVAGQHIDKLYPIIVVPDVDPNILTMFFFSLYNGLMITYGQDWLNVPDQIVRQATLRLLGSEAAILE